MKLASHNLLSILFVSLHLLSLSGDDDSAGISAHARSSAQSEISLGHRTSAAAGIPKRTQTNTEGLGVSLCMFNLKQTD